MHELARDYMAACPKSESPRTRWLTLLERYHDGTQYDHLMRAFDETLDQAGQPVPFRTRRPSTIVPIPRVLVDTFCRALWGAGRRPRAILADGGPDVNAYVDDIISEARLYRAMGEATRRALTIGTGLVVWRIGEGRLSADAWSAQHAVPSFVPGAFPQLASLDYRFRYTTEERDPKTGEIRQVERWHRETIDGARWVVFEDALATAHGEPEWKEDTALSVEHGLGFVPAVWFTIGERGPCEWDGTGVFAPYLAIIDDINWTASQAGRALVQNLDPTTVIAGANEGDVDQLLKGRGAWLLPKDAEAKLLESSGGYVEQATARIDGLRKAIFDAAGIVLPDPERVKGAQSGTSLELLAAPQIARVDALREDVADAFVRLLEQILLALTSPGLAPDKARIDVRDGKPRPQAKLGRVVLAWGAHFPLTPTDSSTAAQAAQAALQAGAISRQAAARYLGRFFGVEDVEADQKLVAADEARQDERERAMERWRQRAGFDDPDAPGADELDDEEDAA
jgi:hypothetical protein